MVSRFALLVVAVVGFAGAGWRVAAGAGTPLYPDLLTLAPTNLTFDVVAIGGGPHYVLRFDNTVWNRGPGRLELEGKKRSKIYQRVYDAAGGGSLVERLYLGNDGVFHAGHNHYHVERFASYQLLAGDGSTELSRGTKTSFCVIDYVTIQGAVAPRYTTCGRTIQGLSVGWGDTYHAHLIDQWVDLGPAQNGAPPLGDGSYVLRSTANPPVTGSSHRVSQIRETDHTNNSAQTCFAVAGGAIVSVAPDCAPV